MFMIACILCLYPTDVGKRIAIKIILIHYTKKAELHEEFCVQNSGQTSVLSILTVSCNTCI